MVISWPAVAKNNNAQASDCAVAYVHTPRGTGQAQDSPSSCRTLEYASKRMSVRSAACRLLTLSSQRGPCAISSMPLRRREPHYGPKRAHREGKSWLLQAREPASFVTLSAIRDIRDTQRACPACPPLVLRAALAVYDAFAGIIIDQWPAEPFEPMCYACVVRRTRPVCQEPRPTSLCSFSPLPAGPVRPAST